MTKFKGNQKDVSGLVKGLLKDRSRTTRGHEQEIRRNRFDQAGVVEGTWKDDKEASTAILLESKEGGQNTGLLPSMLQRSQGSYQGPSRDVKRIP